MKNKKGFTLVEVLVSFVLIVVVVIYLIRTILVVSNKNNQLLTLQEFTVYEDTFLSDIYKDIDIAYNVDSFEGLVDDSTNNQITLKDVNKILTVDPTNDQLIYDDKIYKLPENVTLRQKNGRYYDITPKDGIRPYQIIKIYVTVDGKNDDIKVVYENKNLEDLTITFDPNGGTFTSCSSPYFTNGSTCDFKDKYKTKIPTAPSVTKDNYVFDGWYRIAGEGGAKFVEGGILTENANYVARWKEREYPVVYNLKGGRGGASDVCASENEDCQLPEVSAGVLDDATRLVCYGAKDSYNCKEVHNQIPCNNVMFGDPIYGTAKKCYVDAFLPTSMKASVDYTILKNFYNATREGYHFDYWKLNGAGNALLTRNLPNNYNAFSTGTGNTAWNLLKNPMYSQGKFYADAVWSANTYTLTLDPAGGTYSPNSNSNCAQKSGTSLYECTMTYDSSNNNIVGAPTKGTDIFLGWYTSDGVQVYNASGQNVAATGYWSAAYSTGVWKKASAVTLTAHYKANNCYSISYNLNGGSTSTTNKSSYCQNTAQFTLNNPTKTCNTFKGWSGTGLTGDTNKTVTIPTNSTGNRSYTANWTPNTYSISYNCNGGSGSMAATSVTYGTAVTLRSNACTRTGYTFAGWATSASGNVAYANGASIKPSTCSNITLYAKWTPNPYPVHYDCGNSVTTVSCTYGTTVNTSSQTCSRPGYTFNGWLNGNTAVSTFTCSGEKYLNAKWTANTYQIKYHGNSGNGDEYKKKLKDGFYDAGGEFSNNTFYHYKKFKYDTEGTLATNRFTKSGYTFSHWSEKSDDSGRWFTDKDKVYNLTTTNNGIVHLYAQWRKKTSSTSCYYVDVNTTCTETTSYGLQTASSCAAENPKATWTYEPNPPGGQTTGALGYCVYTYNYSCTKKVFECVEINGSFEVLTH